MSHPDTSHDRENEYPEDNYKPVRKGFKHTKSAALKKKGKFGLGKVGKHDVHPSSPLGKLKNLLNG